MDNVTTAVNTHTARVRRGLAFVVIALLATLGSVFIQVDGASAAPASTNGLYCRTVTIPKTLPWYACLQNIAGTSGTGNGPYGCYTHTKYVCD